MYKYVLRRLLLAVPVLVLSSVIVFGLMRVMPGDALTALMGESGNINERELAKVRKQLGLDKPYVEQYALWIWQLVTLRPGDSIFTGEAITPIGYTSLWDSPWRNLQQFLLPAAVLGFRLAAATMRMTRSTVLEVLREDYVRTAWAKGLGGRIVVYKHALKNALIPVVTIVGGQLGTLLAGTVVVETIFALPGMGRLTVEAILFRDYPVVQTNVMLVAGALVTLNLMVDLTYAWLDPRIRY